MLGYDSYGRDELEAMLDKERENVKVLKKQIEDLQAKERKKVNALKKKIEDLELLIYGIDMRIYYGSRDEIHLKQKKQEKINELEKLKAFLSDMRGSK